MADLTIDELHQDALDMVSVNAEIAAGVKAFNDLLHHRRMISPAGASPFSAFARYAVLLSPRRTLPTFTLMHTGKCLAFCCNSGRFCLRQHRQADPQLHLQVDGQHRGNRNLVCGSYLSDHMRWKHPDTIAKHCPKHLLAGGRGGNKAARRRARKSRSSPRRLNVSRFCSCGLSSGWQNISQRPQPCSTKLRGDRYDGFEHCA